MIFHKPINLVITILILSILLLIVSCDSPAERQAAVYKTLCDIYKKIVPLKANLDIKELKIVAEVQKQLPDFFNANFVHIQDAAAKKRYGFIKRLAQAGTKKKWDCDVMKKYYDTEFH